ncbi:MAG: acetamidase/formamidase family protein [Rubricoccaceae bacterium]|nr:acetamidase/formamidase family protein [Rubricoccaceae bacterium]
MLHALTPERAALHGRFSQHLPPALTIASGDTVRCETLDVGWGLEPRRPDGSRRTVEPRASPRDDGPCLLGPVAVEGAEPGDCLAVHVEAVVPGAYGWTWAGDVGFSNGALNRALGVDEGDPFLLRWTLDAEAGVGTSHLGHRVPLRPFLGCLGTCPGPHHADADGWIDAWVPRRTGGNLDCRALTAGSTLYLPVEVHGALLSLGDGHAAQGDGEAGGTAIECPMARVDLRIERRKAGPFGLLAAPLAKTPEGWVTFGFGASLDAAVEAALLDFLDLLKAQRGLTRKPALTLASVAADVRVTQLVNGVVGAHVVLPHDALLFPDA